MYINCNDKYNVYLFICGRFDCKLYFNSVINKFVLVFLIINVIFLIKKDGV